MCLAGHHLDISCSRMSDMVCVVHGITLCCFLHATLGRVMEEPFVPSLSQQQEQTLLPQSTLPTQLTKWGSWMLMITVP